MEAPGGRSRSPFGPRPEGEDTPPFPDKSAQAWCEPTGGTGLVCDYPLGAARDALRARLAAFYREHKPENIDKVESAMCLAVTETQLFTHLLAAYGVDPPCAPGIVASAAAGMGRSPPTLSISQRARFEPLCCSVASTSARDPVGRKCHVCNYPPGAAREALRSRLTAFYLQHNPAGIDRVDKAMTLQVTEDQLFAHLATVYSSKPTIGSERSSDHDDVATTPATPLSPVAPNGDCFPCGAKADLEGGAKVSLGENWRAPTGGSGNVCDYPPGPVRDALQARLTAFYCEYCSKNLDKVAKAMSLEVTETQLFEHLMATYRGPAGSPSSPFTCRQTI